MIRLPGCLPMPSGCRQHDDLIAQERDDDPQHPGAAVGERRTRCGSGAALRVSEETARKWKRRDSVQDLSATPHTLQTTLSVAQEAVVVELRRILLPPLDDLLAVTRES